ncbi:unnamed protein product, partial [Symbiodinium sp. CCMP2592]
TAQRLRDSHHPGIQQLRSSVLLNSAPEATVEEVNSHMLQQATVLFPAVCGKPTATGVKAPAAGRRNIFTVWTREAKRAWFYDQILGMERPNGELWSPTQQVHCLQTFFKDLYAPEDEPELPSLPPLQAPVITPEEAHHRLSRLPVHKATPSHQAPTAATVACADILAPWFSRKVGALSSFPAVWSDCWLFLMPKVSHPVLPRQFRPIGLTESTGRALAGHLQDALKPYLQAFVGPWPQLAYMAGRSTGEALHRVFSHCHTVSAANKKPVYNIHAARAKLTQAASSSSRQTPSSSGRLRTGGVQASLDLSQAFDRLSWHLIHDALIEAQVPLELRVQLLEFYRGLGYHLAYGSETALRGVKQGCRVAPLLWSLATGLLLRRLARVTSSEWVRRALTAFADDFHIGQVIHSSRDLLLAIERLGLVLQLLIEARMKVNIDKSVVLLLVNHSYASRWRRREIVSDKQGPRLRISTPSVGILKLPIVDSHKFLGGDYLLPGGLHAAHGGLPIAANLGNLDQTSAGSHLSFCTGSSAETQTLASLHSTYGPLRT